MNDMEEQDKSVTYYLIPSNVSAKFEFFEGFGWSELKTVAIALAIGALIFFLSGFITSSERVEKSKMTYDQTIGLKIGKNIFEDGNYYILKKEIIPLPIRVLFVVVPTLGAYFFVKRDPSTKMSLISTIKFSRAFRKRQRRYLYKYGSGAEG